MIKCHLIEQRGEERRERGGERNQRRERDGKRRELMVKIDKGFFKRGV